VSGTKNEKAPEDKRLPAPPDKALRIWPAESKRLSRVARKA